MTTRPKFGTPSNVFWILITFAAVLVWAFWFQTWAWHEARRMEKLDRCLALIPRPLPDESASQAPAIKQAYFGYEFETPWPGPETTKQNSALVDLIFHGDYGVLFWNPAERHNLLENPSAVAPHPNMKDAMGAILGGDAVQSNYDLLKSQLNMTPAKVLPALSRREANRRLALLRMKGALECSRKPAGFYFFQSENLKCIQTGDPALDSPIEVRCFDPGDHEFNFLFSTRKDSGLRISQLEINRVIQTLRPAAAPQPAAPGSAKN